MKKFIQNKLKEQKGLTLIELLAVIVILAIIAAIAIPAIGNIIENSRVGAAKSDALNMFSAAQLYLVDNPDALTDSVKTITYGELKDGGYVEDLGGFGESGATPPSFSASTASGTGATAVKAGKPLLSGVAIVGGVKVTFANASKEEVEKLSNSARPTTGTIIVGKK